MIKLQLDARCVAILNKLTTHEDYVSLNELAKHINVSKRSVYYDLNRINDWCEMLDIAPLVVERAKGILLSGVQKENIINHLENVETAYMVLQPKERAAIIICSLLAQQEPSFIEYFASVCDVSRNTIFNDFKEVRKKLKRYGLTLQFETHVGYSVEGSTIRKRAVFLYYLETVINLKEQGIDLTKLSLNFYDQEAIEKNMLRFKEIERKLNITYVSGVLFSLSVLVSNILVKNIAVDLEDVDQEEIMASSEYAQIKSVFKHLPSNEQIYFAMHLLGSRVQVPLKKKLDENIIEMSKEIVGNFERIACVSFHKREQLVSMLAQHLQMSIYRYRYGIQLGNPLIEEIRKSYADLFDITKKALHSMKQELAFPIPNSEVAYITMHFGGFLKNQSDTYRVKVIIVCPNGISTAYMLKSEVESLHPSIDVVGIVSVDELDKYSNQADFVISTVDVNAYIPVLRVNPIISEEDRMRILSKMVSEQVRSKPLQKVLEKTLKIVSNYVGEQEFEQVKKDIENAFYASEYRRNNPYSISLLDVITQQDIHVVQNVASWQQAITLASQPLLQSNKINESYVQSMIDSVDQYGPYIVISPQVALAHALPKDNVFSLSVSMLKINEPIYFDNEQVSVVLVLAPIDEKSHLGILKDIMDLFNQSKFVKKLFDAIDSNTILNLLTQYQYHEGEEVDEIDDF